MKKLGRILPVLTLLLVAGSACADAAEQSGEPAELESRTRLDGELDRALGSDTTMVGDSLAGGVGTAPAAGTDPAGVGAPGGSSQPSTGAPPSGSPGSAPQSSSARDGSGPPGGDDLGGRRDVGAPASPETDAILTRASEAYAAIRTLRAEFRQTTRNPVLGRTTTSRGTIYQARPDRFLMRFSEPDGDRIVADGTHIWVYYPSVDDRQVIRMPAGAGGAGAVDLQAQFLGDPTERFSAELVGTEDVNGRPAWLLDMTPRGGANYRSLRAWVDQGDHLVRRFEITEHNGVVRRFELSDLTPGASIDAAMFRFTPPPGTHVVSRG